MINSINISNLRTTENENTIYMPCGFIDTVEHVLQRKGVQVHERTEKRSTEGKDIAELLNRISWYKFFLENACGYTLSEIDEGWVKKGELYYYKNKNTNEYELGSFADYNSNAAVVSSEPDKAMLIAIDEDGFRRLFPVCRVIAAMGTHVCFHYEIDDFVSLCLDILNDREGIQKMRAEEEEEQRKADEEYHK